MTRQEFGIVHFRFSVMLCILKLDQNIQHFISQNRGKLGSVTNRIVAKNDAIINIT